MEKAATLKRAVDSVDRRYRSQAYPADIRQRVVAYTQTRRARGESWRRIGRSVGLRAETVRRWCAEATPGPTTALVPVEVSDAARASTPAPGPVLVSPGGWRVEGLSLAEVAELVGRLP